MSIEQAEATSSEAASSSKAAVGLSSHSRAHVGVLDTGAFVGGYKLEDLADQLFTVQEVVDEVRDPKARQLLDSGVMPVQLREPSDAAIKFVSSFARKTGDFNFLSKTDIKVMALTYQIYVERNGNQQLRTKPIGPAPSRPVTTSESDSTSTESVESTSESVIESAQTVTESVIESVIESAQTVTEPVTESVIESVIESAQTVTESVIESAQTVTEPVTQIVTESVIETVTQTASELETISEQDIDGDDGEWLVSQSKKSRRPPKSKSSWASSVPSMSGDWITPDNLKKTQKKDRSVHYGADKQDKEVKLDVACVTRDFSMQNVLMQIGLSVLSEDGMLIRRAKRWALRCFSCNTPERDTARIFCRHCGNNTMRRIAMVSNADGSVWYAPLRYTPSKRGAQVTIPPPRPGRRATAYVTSEDQLAMLSTQRRYGHGGQNIRDPDYQFASETRRDNTQQRKIVVVGHGRKNPNESRKRVNKKKKRTAML